MTITIVVLATDEGDELLGTAVEVLRIRELASRFVVPEASQHLIFPNSVGKARLTG